MPSTTATAQSYNDTNVLGQVLSIGAAKNTGKFLAAIGGMNGAKRVLSQAFDMNANYSLDTPSATANLISENTSLSAGTSKFYAKTPQTNYVQAMKYDIIVSDLRLAALKQVVSTTFISDNLPMTSEFDVQAALKMQQLAADWEAVCLSGSIVARSAVSTNVAAGGLIDTTIGITTNKVNASSAALDSSMISDLLVTMQNNGAPFQNLAIVAKPTYVDQLNTLYGFAPQSITVGGVSLNMIMTTFGPVTLICTNTAPANKLLVTDLNYISPVVMPHANGSDIIMKEYVDGSSAQKGYIEGYIGVDFGHESYHGMVYGLA